MKYSDQQRLQKMLSYTQKILKFVKENSITKDQILSNEPLQWLLTTPLYNIGEHAYYLSDDTKKKFPVVDWDMIAGLRHRLVHDYEGTNWEIIVDIVFSDLPELKGNLDRILSS
jgi:uncharacterized protein with HEPN domain